MRDNRRYFNTMSQGVGAVTTEGISILINESGGGCLDKGFQ